MSNARNDKNLNHNNAKNDAAASARTADRAPVFSNNGIDLNIEKIDELAADASPRQLKTWISHLEALYEKKRADNRAQLKNQVDKLLLSNDYSVEELYAARPIPTLEELADHAKNRKKNKQSKREKMISGMLGG